MIEGGQNRQILPLWVFGPLWAGPLWDGPSWGRPSLGTWGPGPCGPPWVLMGRALMGPLMGQALMDQALMGRALVGLLGLLWVGPLWPPWAHSCFCFPRPDGPKFLMAHPHIYTWGLVPYIENEIQALLTDESQLRLCFSLLVPALNPCEECAGHRHLSI